MFRQICLAATAIAALSGFAVIGPAGAEPYTTEYRVRGNDRSFVTINLNSGGPYYVGAMGDGRTDIDFVIRDARGNIIHEDYGLVDTTSVRINRSGRYEIELINIGNTTNIVRIHTRAQGDN